MTSNTDTAPFTLTTSALAHTVTPDFPSSEATIWGMVERIKRVTTYLSNYGVGVKGVKVTEAKNTAREIRGMISLLNSVCDCPSLQAELIVEMSVALDIALDRLRK